jgi:enduracididine beta-hydroxylase
MYQVKLSIEDLREIREIVRVITSEYDSVEDAEFLRKSPIFAQEMPTRLREGLSCFRLSEVAGVCLVTGYPVDDTALGATPQHWQEKSVPSLTLAEEIYFFLCGSLLGEPVGWSTQQGGNIVHDLHPIRGNEKEQLGTGSEVALTWHTEEAFHPYRADYLGLMCLRNHDGVETTVGSLENVRLDDESKNILFENHFSIKPDESHLEKNRPTPHGGMEAPAELLKRSYARIQKMHEQPEPVSVLFGDRGAPYMRLDPYFMDEPTDNAARKALAQLTHGLDSVLYGIALSPGEVLFIDNYRVVHGRRSFKARYDGTDRWFKRLNITRDLRKSRDSRVRPEDRVIF